MRTIGIIIIIIVISVCVHIGVKLGLEKIYNDGYQKGGAIALQVVNNMLLTKAFDTTNNVLNLNIIIDTTGKKVDTISYFISKKNFQTFKK